VLNSNSVHCVKKWFEVMLENAVDNYFASRLLRLFCLGEVGCLHSLPSDFFMGSNCETVSCLPLFTAEIHLQYGTASGVVILTCSACSVSVDVGPPC